METIFASEGLVVAVVVVLVVVVDVERIKIYEFREMIVLPKLESRILKRKSDEKNTQSKRREGGMNLNEKSWNKPFQVSGLMHFQTNG
jgi:hypothetical protein